MKTTNDVVLELLDRDAEAEELEALVADIKAILYSPFQSVDMKITNCKLAIGEAGY
jgi:hypothetical protein